MVAVLVNKPFYLTPKQVGDLTWAQITDLYFAPRDDSGQVDLDPAAEEFTNRKGVKAASWRDVCFLLWRRNDPGVSEADMVAKFDRQYPGYAETVDSEEG